MNDRSNRLRGQALWAITAYFPFDDPPGVKRRLRAHREFRRRLQAPLVAVELSRGGPFDLGAADAEILIQVRGGALLWQKERLLNIALQSLPDHCDMVAWLDCDVIFERTDWFAAARSLLEEHALVQCFRRARYLAGDDQPAQPPHRRPVKTLNSLVSRLAQGTCPRELCSVSAFGRGCTPGMAWAARRETLAGQGFYDAMILGSGDKMMFCAACGGFEEGARSFRLSAPHREHYVAWARTFSERVQGRLACLDGDIYHLWHGDLAFRYYRSRYDGFENFEFDPAADIARSEDGVWRWNSNKPEMHAFVRRYFERRQGGAAQ